MEPPRACCGGRGGGGRGAGRPRAQQRQPARQQGGTERRGERQAIKKGGRASRSPGRRDQWANGTELRWDPWRRPAARASRYRRPMGTRRSQGSERAEPTLVEFGLRAGGDPDRRLGGGHLGPAASDSGCARTGGGASWRRPRSLSRPPPSSLGPPAKRSPPKPGERPSEHGSRQGRDHHLKVGRPPGWVGSTHTDRRGSPPPFGKRDSLVSEIPRGRCASGEHRSRV